MKTSSMRNGMAAWVRRAAWGLGGWVVLATAATPAWSVERGPAATTAAPAPASAEARVIVKYKANSVLMRALSAPSTAAASTAVPQQAKTLSQRLGIALQDGRGLGPRSQLLTAQGIGSQELADRLAADSDIEYAVVDGRKRALAVPNDPLYPGGQTTTTPAVGQWYLRAPDSTAVSAINAQAAWNVTTGRGSVVVAVLDTGVRPEHPDLQGKLLPGYDFVSNATYANDGGGRDADPSDPGDWVTEAENASGTFKDCGTQNSSWHGTETAGLIAAATNNGIGMAGAGRDVRLLPLRVLGKCGGFDSDIIDAMRWAAGLHVNNVPDNPNKARVVNLSLGGSGACSAAYLDAVGQLAAAGVTVVAAAGNDGLAVGTPANCAGVIAVAGVRHAGTKVGYSDLGPEVAISAPAGNCVNDTGPCLYALLTTSNTGTTAPVASTYTTDGANATIGTSFSAPLVSSTVALMLTANPALTPASILQALKTTARPFPSAGAPPVNGIAVAACVPPGSTVPAQSSECYCTTSTCGAGLLNAGAAVSQVVATTPVANIYATPKLPAAASPTAPVIPLVGAEVTLDGTGSLAASGAVPTGAVRALSATALAGALSTYQWAVTSGSGTFKNGVSTGPVVTLIPSAAGPLAVSLTVSDGSSAPVTASTTLAVAASPTASIGLSATSVAPGASITLNGSGSTAAAGLSIIGYQWAITSGGEFASLSNANTASPTLSGTAAGAITLSLTVTDSAGQQGSASTPLTVAVPAAGGGGGGGALGLQWLAALALAVVALARVGAMRRR